MITGIRKYANEIIATLVVIIVMAGTPVLLSYHAPWKDRSGKRLIFLTAVASQGIWTKDRVNGTNYWNKEFTRAKIILRKGEEVIFRFTSIDVTHTFYVPELGIGPFEVLPGHIYDVPFKAVETGRYIYYCTTVCGNCHFFMQGSFVIFDKDDFTFFDMLSGLDTKINNPVCCTPGAVSDDPGQPLIVNNGKALFQQKACFTCHGANGAGGVFNPNYAKFFIPPLNNLADKLKIPSKEDADSLIKLFTANADLVKLEENPPFRMYNRFLAQYQSITKKITDGASVLQKRDSSSYEPPLFMPSWENNLSGKEINSIIAYLISINNWEED